MMGWLLGLALSHPAAFSPAVDQALKRQREGRFGDALRLWVSGAGAGPQRRSAWSNRGNVQLALGAP